MSGLWLLCLLLFPLGALLEDAAAWYGRNAAAAGEDGDEEREDRHRWARRAVEARLVSRLALGLGFAGATAGAVELGGNVFAGVVVLAGALGACLLAALSGTEWRSPMALLGRAIYRPLAPVGSAIRVLLRSLGRLPGVPRPWKPMDIVAAMERERRWVLGRGENDASGDLMATLREFGTSTVEEVMVRREEMLALPAEATLADIAQAISREGHSRYPVYRGSRDTVIGVLHVFDLLAAPEGVTAADLVRPAFFTHETKSVNALLRELQVSYNQMAIVADEYGGIAGVVTIEDLLEELVGEIEDEHDEEESPLRRLDPGVFWVDATMRIEDLNERLQLHLGEGEYDTVAGLVLERLERVPRAGERIAENGVEFEIAAAEPHRIRAVRLYLESSGHAAERKRS